MRCRFDADWPYGDEVLVRRFIPGHELTVAVLGDRALGVTEAALAATISTIMKPNTPMV